MSNKNAIAILLWPFAERIKFIRASLRQSLEGHFERRAAAQQQQCIVVALACQIHNQMMLSPAAARAVYTNSYWFNLLEQKDWAHSTSARPGDCEKDSTSSATPYRV